MLAKRWQQAAE